MEKLAYQATWSQTTVCGTNVCGGVHCHAVTTLAKTFGTVVRRRREAASMSQEGLADTAGLHRTYISLLERGLRTPSILVVQKLAKALDTSMVSIIRDVENA